MATVAKVSKTKKVSLKKAVTAHNKVVNKSNKAFEKMKPAEKRVQIARDVLFQLNSGKLIAAHRLWLGANKDDDVSFISDSEIKKNAELQDILGKRKECYGCALGGMFMCAVERANKLKVGKLNFNHDQEKNTIHGNDVFSYMKKFFDKKQLFLIELAFEGGAGSCYTSGGSSIIMDDQHLSVSMGHDEGYEASCFASFETPSEKMRLIMENIVANNGTFRFDKKPIRVVKYVTPNYLDEAFLFNKAS